MKQRTAYLIILLIVATFLMAYLPGGKARTRPVQTLTPTSQRMTPLVTPGLPGPPEKSAPIETPITPEPSAARDYQPGFIAEPTRSDLEYDPWSYPAPIEPTLPAYPVPWEPDPYPYP